MKRSAKYLAVCTAAVMTVSATAGMSVMASEDKAFSIDMTNNTDEMWAGLAMTNDDTVNTGANIRSAADANGEVVACLYRGGAVEVLHKGDEWSEVKSGKVTGYIKNEYLMFGTEAKGLADYYGVDGVEASWDDVHVFAQPSADAKIIHTAKAGEAYQVVSDEGHWITVQYGADQLAYVSEEDVKRVLLVDEAIPLDENGNYVDTSADDTSYSEDNSDSSWSDPGYSDSSDNSYDQGSWDSSSGSDSSSSDNSGNSDSDNSGSYDDGSSDDTSWDDGSDDYVEDDNSDDSYTDDGSYDDSYDDSNDIEDVDGAEEFTDNNTSSGSDSYDDSYTDDAYTDDSDTDDTYTDYNDTEYTDDTYTEDTTDNSTSYDDGSQYTDDTTDSSSSSVSSSDLDLMAAIIYCEAGNQSYEGMVAVGAVVMNRVASSSFPNSVSEVIYQSGQFTPAYSGALSSALANGVPSACYDAASAALAGENPVGGAMYFNTGSGSGIKIGAHQFY